MNIARMHREFMVGYDKSNDLSYPDIRPEERDLFLNKAIESIVKQRYSGNNARKESVEETQKRRDDLRNITSNYSTTTFITNQNNKENGVFVDLPADYWFALEEEAVISHLDCHDVATTSRVLIKPITHDRYNRIKYDPFNKPNKIEVVSLPYEDFRNEIIVDDDSTVEEYFLRYLRKPVEVNLANGIDCDLSEHLHREIIDYAVNLAIENIESPRFQTQSSELYRNE